MVLGDVSLSDMTSAVINGDTTINGKKLFKKIVGEKDFTITVYGIPEESYLNDITAIPYVYDGANYHFPSYKVTRNIYEVAKSAYEDSNEDSFIVDVLETKSTNVTYNLNGGYFGYATLSDMEADYVNDAKTATGKDYADLLAVHNDSFGKKPWADSTFVSKWGWILNYLKTKGVEDQYLDPSTSVIYYGTQNIYLMFKGSNNATEVANGVSFASKWTCVDFTSQANGFWSSYIHSTSEALSEVGYLPSASKEGLYLEGWKSSVDNKDYTKYTGYNGNDSITYTAVWGTGYDGTDIMDSLSDNVTISTLDTLPSKDGNYTLTWSSNSDAYQIKDGKGYTLKQYQTHANQNVTITLTADNGFTTKTITKEIVVGPVVYNTISTTPVATYFATSASYAYRAYNSYYLSTGKYFSDDIADALDIVYYSAANPKADGTIELSGGSYISTYMSQLNELKNNDVRILVSLGGCGSEAGYLHDITADSELLATFCENFVDLLEQYHFDGIDIDWEFESSATGMTKTTYSALVNGLYNEMASRQASGGTPYMLTAAIPSNTWSLSDTQNRFDFALLNTKLDYINLMSYDLIYELGNKQAKASHHTNLYPSALDKAWKFGITYAMGRLQAIGFSQSKVIVGCAGYGKLMTIGTNLGTNHEVLSTTGTLTNIADVPGSFASGTIFSCGIEYLLNSSSYNFVEYTEYINTNQLVGSYLYDATNGYFITYDSETSVIAKYNYAKSIPGAGIMCWSYSEDTNNSVINAIIEAMK